MRHRLALSALLAALLAAPAAADAFCGFYVSGAGAEMFNNATQVVMMRSGSRTVLSMQNNYQGPAEDFAMVVPVPVVLQKANVKTLPHEIFARVDKLSAPRLVEYWEMDPCYVEPPMVEADMAAAPTDAVEEKVARKGMGVKIEAQFKVGEYDIVILSAKEATGLERWLKANKYKIPAGAAPYLKPYVEGGSKFFVARVDVEKVQKVDGRLTLSPLRFHYDSKDFALPIRLGMMNSAGTQDLIVHILAPAQRYQVANYKNATIPTNLDVKEEARQRFGEFYAALYDRTLEKNPGAVVTEYSWDASSCDPCPEPPLEPGELATLGGDVLGAGDSYDFVLTRLHARYAKDGIKEDLVFKTAEPIQGGREMPGASGKLEEGAQASSMNNFQGRYAIRHEWTGPIACEHPVRGRWGGPPPDKQQVASGPVAATDLAFVPRGQLELARVVRSDVPEIGVKSAATPDKAPPASGQTAAKAPDKPIPAKKEKNGCAVGGSSGAIAALGVLLLVAVLRRRRNA
jgi:MYXO-CTERM domain-containing protein